MNEAQRPNHAFRALEPLLPGKRCIVIVGLPVTGKSALVREAARMAAARSRTVHLLQWDVARLAWDRPEILARFPEVDGVTHSAIRGAIGMWARPAIQRWFLQHAGDDDFLIVEAPIIAGRLAALAKRLDDRLEQHLAGEETLFVVIAPSVRLQRALRERRAQECATGDALERHNASLDVVDVQLAAVEEAARRLGNIPRTPGRYDPEFYLELMCAVLRHRRVLMLRPDSLIDTHRSVYDFDHAVVRIGAAPEDVAWTLHAAERDPESLRRDAELGWSDV
jgi:hypothetical protein